MSLISVLKRCKEVPDGLGTAIETVENDKNPQECALQKIKHEEDLNVRDVGFDKIFSFIFSLVNYGPSKQ